MKVQERLWAEPEHLGTFRENRHRPIHRWFPFVEGYSAQLVREALALRPQGLVFDPFGGSGTTLLEAALEGRKSSFAEVNPYMAWVADVKVNQSSYAVKRGDLSGLKNFGEWLKSGPQSEAVSNHALLKVDEERQFFPPGVAALLVSILRWIDEGLVDAERELARLACATSIIPCSNMVRRTDLRRRTSGDPPPRDLLTSVREHLADIVADVISEAPRLRARTKRAEADVRNLQALTEKATLLITSPPYLNGTNYFRNTKLELIALGFLGRESELGEHRARCITAGINNVSRRRPDPRRFSYVEKVALELDTVAYDTRIPRLVRGYFADMFDALNACRRIAADDALFLMDIGDSRFAGVHVPTDSLLISVAEEANWRHIGTRVLRARRSYDGSELRQVVLEMRAS